MNAPTPGFIHFTPIRTRWTRHAFLDIGPIQFSIDASHIRSTHRYTYEATILSTRLGFHMTFRWGYIS